jgi:cystathionine beta-lyase/cystathionine gamma-synthase
MRKYKNLFKGNLIRVYCGLEDSSDQIKDIINSLKALK